MFVSGYRAMWLVVLFDLPVNTKARRKKAGEFRRDLRNDGFMMLQFSVYARPCASEDNARTHLGRVWSMLPEAGRVRVLQLTDKQYGRMQCFEAGNRVDTEAMPKQLELF